MEADKIAQLHRSEASKASTLQDQLTEAQTSIQQQESVNVVLQERLDELIQFKMDADACQQVR